MANSVTTLNYLTNAQLPFYKCVRPRVVVVGFAARFHKTDCAFGRKLYSGLCFFRVGRASTVNNFKRKAWSIRSSTDGRGLDPSSTNSPSNGTRLIRAIQAIQTKLSARIQELRKNFPMKLLFFLVGFYCATAFATVIGQTGDWDILSAALAVVIVEGIGALMYKSSLSLFSSIRSLITMFNYWKAGLSLGLFLDSFKYELDNIFGFSNPLNFDVDMFPVFL